MLFIVGQCFIKTRCGVAIFASQDTGVVDTDVAALHTAARFPLAFIFPVRHIDIERRSNVFVIDALAGFDSKMGENDFLCTTGQLHASFGSDIDYQTTANKGRVDRGMSDAAVMVAAAIAVGESDGNVIEIDDSDDE